MPLLFLVWKARIFFFAVSVACLGVQCTAQTIQSGKDERDTARTNSNFNYSGNIPGNYVDFAVDALENIYLLTAGYQLKKLSPRGDSLAVFNNVRKYGNPSYIDVSNPLKILVYYKSYSTVAVLDRFLTVRNTINFRKENIFSVKAIATTYDNNIWIFDEQDYKLKKIDDDGKLLQESIDMRLLVDSVPSPSRIIDSDNFVFLYDEAKGFFIFDYYGALRNNLRFNGWQNTAIAGNTMYGFSADTLYTYALNTVQLKKYPLPRFLQGNTTIKAINNKVYLLKPEGLEIYLVK